MRFRPFGLRAVNLTEAHGAKKGAQLNLANSDEDSETEAATLRLSLFLIRTLCTNEFKGELEKFKCKTLFIADEVHNLGSEGFISGPPDFFNYRLGLSATPIRQYDEEGTEHLLEFFGPIVFQFTLEEAIGRCLVGYEYYVHPVELTEDEMEEWYALTETDW